MGLFKPLYLDKNQEEYEREKALNKEKDRRRLREFALDRTQDEHLRGVAIIKANDPGLCEAVLMERASESPAGSLMPFQLEHYEKAALVLSELGEQKRLEKILALCVKYQIQVIVMNYIKNTKPRI